MPNLITLTTDFGYQDAYVASMKGVILSRNPDVRLVDVSHEIEPQEVMSAAFVLKQAVPYFPEQSVHLVVVDPGVGTSRKTLAMRKNGHVFVGPDNGLFSLLFDGEEPEQAVELTNRDFWQSPAPSETFHGRDIMAPVAAHLAAGVPLEEMGEPVDEISMLRWAMPIVDDQGVQGWTVHIDRFGNCISNIPKSLFEKPRSDRTFKCYVGGEVLERIHPTYATVPEGDPLMLFGSSGYLEIAVNGGNAAELLSIRKGDTINIVFLEQPA